MNPSDIINKSDQKSKSRAEKQPIEAKLYKIDGNKILYTVNSSHHNKQYLVTIQLLDFITNKLDSLKDALAGNIKISCNCPGFLYKGLKYISWKGQVGIDKETRRPDITNPDLEGLACKHILVALNQMKSDYNAIYKMFKDAIPKEKPSTSDKEKKAASDVSENDIEVIDRFKEACSSLYKSYIKFKKENKDENLEFADSEFYDGKDPSKILSELSKATTKAIANSFLGKLDSLNNILKLIDQKKNGFNVLLNSDVSSLTKKINSIINNKTESLINNIILTLM